MSFNPDFEPVPAEFRALFTGQALGHLDEIVLNWQTGGHPISWATDTANFEIYLDNSNGVLFRLHAPAEGYPACLEVDVADAFESGIPAELTQRLWAELAYIGEITENDYVPIRVSLGKFSRGDRKVFMAYALTIARQIARPPEL
jgi:hypothetical protein